METPHQPPPCPSNVPSIAHSAQISSPRRRAHPPGQRNPLAPPPPAPPPSPARAGVRADRPTAAMETSGSSVSTPDLGRTQHERSHSAATRPRGINISHPPPIPFTGPGKSSFHRIAWQKQGTGPKQTTCANLPVPPGCFRPHCPPPPHPDHRSRC